MPLTLILMRHAKSSWTDLSQDDFDRSLNRRGRLAAPMIAKWLVEKGHLADQVLTSGARRTQETWERMANQMPKTAVMESNPALYLAGPDIMLSVLRSQTAPSVMMIAHNPGIAVFATRIAVQLPDHPKLSAYPTAATAVIEFDAATWANVDWSTGKVLDFVVPKDLEDEANAPRHPT